MRIRPWLFIGALGMSWAFAATAQETSGADGATDQDALLTDEELQTLVAPIALYPDTLLIQILVASTYPLEIIKADALVDANADAGADDLAAKVDEKGWDESVSVLATAFPDVLSEMADHVEWTESMGTAMLAQSDDVMDAVQVKRVEAQEAGSLTSNEQQTVEVTQEGDAGDTIVIQPTDPEVVYVPQYDPEVVYVDDGNNAGDAVAAGLIAFTTFAVIDEIFDDDDPWNNYWGCRNCGGWGGQPIVRNPNIDIDVDGNVNIGNDLDLGWRPDERRQDDARDRIADHRGEDGATRLPVKGPDRGDQMRENLTRQTGAADIARDRVAADQVADKVKARPQIGGGEVPSLGDKVRSEPHRTVQPKAKVSAPAATKIKKPSTASAPARQAASNRGAALKSAPAARSNAGSARGRASAGGRSRPRR